MGLSILNNIPSLEAQNQLATTNTNLQNTLFQLSSGSKINSGADDPAGLSIADGLQANISALTQSAQNVTDGVGMLQTADGALSQVTTLLNRAVTLATEAGNAGLTSDQQNALQTEFASITQEINQIGSNTTYNNNQVFTNRLTSVFLSDGSQTDAADPTISVTIPQLSAGSLGLSSYATGTLDLTANPTAGNTVQIGQQVYTFVASGSANNAGDVALGSGTGALQTTLQNLTNAVNGTGTAGSGSYGVGTAANTEARIITPTNGGSVSIQALTAGAAGNSVQIVANLTSNVGSVTGTLSGGVTATDSTGTLTLAGNPTVLSTATASLTMSALPDTQAAAFGNIAFGSTQPTTGNSTGVLTLAAGNASDGDTVKIGNTSYTFTASGTFNSATAGEVEIVSGSAAGTMANLVAAINGATSAGVGANTNAAGSVVVTGYTSGTTANMVSIAHDGTGVNLVQNNLEANLTGNTAGGGTSDTITVGNTAYTFVAAGTATSGNEVAVGGTVDQTLQNLANAVNLGGTGGSANTYATTAASAGTEKMTDLGSGNAIVTAITAGTAGNGLPLSATGTIANLVNPNNPNTTGLSGGQNADTVQIGTQVYTFVNQGMATAANEISIVNSPVVNGGNTMADNIQATLANLQAALASAGGQAGSDSTFGIGTAAAPGYATITGFTQNANGSVTATLAAGAAGAGQTAAWEAANGGPASNGGTGVNVTVTPNSQAGSLSAGAWSGGVNADTVTLGNTTYTFVGFGAATQGNEVALGSTQAQTLQNLMAAVNYNGAVPGGGYGATVGGETNAFHLANAAALQSSTPATGVSMTVSGNVATLTDLVAGANTTTPLSDSFALGTATGTVSGAGDLAGGVGNTAASGNFVLNNNPQDGNTVTIGSTAYTFVSSTGELSNANTVLINTGSVTTTLNNLKAAVTGATGTGIGAGVNYGTGTVANSMVADTASGMSSTGFVVSGNQATITSSATGAGTAETNGAPGTGNYMVLSANLTNGVGGAVIPTPTTLTGGSNSANTKASGILALTANDIGANDQVTIGNQVWTFVSGTATGQQVQVNSNTTVAQAVSGLVSAYNALNNPTPGAGQVTLAVDASNPDQATVTANTAGTGGNNIALIIGNGNTLGGGGAGVDLSSSANAQAALTVIAGAISTVASTRGAIGSSINQMNAAVQVMSNTSQNLTSSLSGIQDANIGKVVANMSKYQVLEQTGIAALTQANQQEQTVLKLLQ